MLQQLQMKLLKMQKKLLILNKALFLIGCRLLAPNVFFREYFMENFFSAVSPEFIEPFFPVSGEKLIIRIRVKKDEDISKINLMLIGNGNYYRQLMTKEGNYYSVTVKMPKKKIRYYFEITYKNREYIYYTIDGLQKTCPVWTQGFTVLSDLKTASWIPGGVCYQIFPDRFRKGDPNVGVKDGDFESNGFVSHTCEWGSVPKEYLNAGCVDFYNGDLKGIADSIGHLKEIGVSAVYLNPIGTAHTVHRYDCIDFFHIDPNLGGDEAYINLIDELHKAGIRVITDISINHTGVDSKWFKSALAGEDKSSYYYKENNGCFAYWEGVSTLPQLNYNSDELRDEIYRADNSVIRKFLRPPFNQDGWRFDVADTVGRHDEDDFCHEIWKEVRKVIKKENPEAYIVAEDWDDAGEYLQGDQWDATMNYLGCSRLIRRWMGEADRFQLGAWGHNPYKVKNYSGEELAKALSDQLKRIPGQLVFQQFNLIDSHDCPRLHNDKNVFDFDLYVGAISLMYMLPGIPNIYYGDEIGLDGKLGSVEKSRYSMEWNKEKWDMRFFNLYKKLGELRKQYRSVFRQGSWRIPYADNQIMIFERFSKEDRVMLILNRCEETKTISLDLFEGLTNYNTGENCSSEICLEPRKSLILAGKRKTRKNFRVCSDGEGI